MTRPPVALVHDYLTQRGGAERVVLAMLKAFPDAPVYTTLYEPQSTFPEFADHDVRPLWTNRLTALRHDHRKGLLLYPMAFSGRKVDADVVLCSSSGFAHGVRTTGRKVVYCYTPARWLYGEAPAYLANWPTAVKAVVRAAGPVLRRWDRRGMASADRVLTSSSAVADRINVAYGRTAGVVPPPPGLMTQGEERPMKGINPGFILSVGRLLSYKNVDAVISSMALLPQAQLVVAGDGPERERLASLSGSNVTLLGEVGDPELRWLYRNCAGIVSAAYEDYGLSPLEAAACGKPAAALRHGGFLDTVVAGETGVFFDDVDPVEVAAALSELISCSWDATRIADHAAEFSEQSFGDRLRTIVHEGGHVAANHPRAGRAI